MHVVRPVLAKLLDGAVVGVHDLALGVEHGAGVVKEDKFGLGGVDEEKLEEEEGQEEGAGEGEGGEGRHNFLLHFLLVVVYLSVSWRGWIV